jgi:hypothetical protein
MTKRGVSPGTVLGTPSGAKRCELCEEERTAGTWLSVKPGGTPAWVCEDCQEMLLLRVDDHGTQGVVHPGMRTAGPWS